MSLAISRQTARKVKRSQITAKAGLVGSTTGAPKANRQTATTEEDFVPVTNQALSDLQLQFHRARGGTNNTIKSQKCYHHLRQAILKAEERRESTRKGQPIHYAPHPPLERAKYGSELAVRASKQTVGKYVKEETEEDKSATGWCMRHLEKSKVKVPLPKVLNKVFTKAEMKQRAEDNGREKNSSQHTQHSQAISKIHHIHTSPTRAEKVASKKSLGDTSSALLKHTDTNVTIDSSGAFGLSTIQEPTKAFSDIDEDEDADIDTMLQAVAQCKEDVVDTEDGEFNSKIRFYNRKLPPEQNAKAGLTPIEHIFASHPHHHLHRKLMEALDASNWAEDEKDRKVEENRQATFGSKQGEATKRQAEVPAYVGYVSRQAPNAEQALNLAIDSTRSGNFWAESALKSGENRSRTVFRINEIIPDPGMKKKVNQSSIPSKDDIFESLLPNKGLNQDKTKNTSVFPENQKLSPAFNLLKCLFELAENQNKMTNDLILRIHDLDHQRADLSRRRFFSFPGTDDIENEKRQFHTDMGMMRVGIEVLRLAQASHNIEHANWYKELSLKTHGANAPNITLAEKKLLLALRHVVKAGYGLNEQLFLDIMLETCSKDDYASLPFQRLVAFIRDDIIGMPIENHQAWLLKHKIPYPSHFEEHLREAIEARNARQASKAQKGAESAVESSVFMTQKT